MPRHTPRTTLHRGSTLRRWRTAVAFSLSVAIGFASTSAASAATNPPATDDAPAALAASAARVVEFPMSTLWTDRFWGYGDSPRNGDTFPVPIGRDTRTLVLDVDIEPLGPVVCAFGHEEDDGPMATVQWTTEEWSSDAPKTFPLPSVTGSHYLRCRSGAVEQPRWEINWFLNIQREDVGPVAVLTTEEKYLTVSGATHHYNSLGPAIPVHSGVLVQVSGAPGTWPRNGQVRVSLLEPNSRSVIRIDDAVVSADGSSVEFRMAAEPSPNFFGPDASFEVTASSSAEGPPRLWENTMFRAPLVFAAEPEPVPNQQPSTVTVSLSGRYALWFQRRSATAVVKTAGIPTPTGTVSFAVNGRPVGTTPLGANGKAAFRLPALDRGRYSITAIFTPTTGTPSAVSPGAWLRVLL